MILLDESYSLRVAERVLKLSRLLHGFPSDHQTSTDSLHARLSKARMSLALFQEALRLSHCHIMEGLGEKTPRP